ncbi:MAG: hypothetical protein LHV69_00445 [Elusimicrobia bacterium]|nr:hypothetical protein [Candidatus Obscuribacterium magneticum]MCB4755498.1 hypothetical protein [Candidatus Obscuribacterium magneticum]
MLQIKTAGIGGGAWINGGFTTGTYIVRGVPDGTYRLNARAQGYMAQTLENVVVDHNVGDTVNQDFPEFETGGTITGNITINGDTSVLDEDEDGDFTLDISAWNPSTYIGSWTQLTISTGSPQTIVPFSLTGLMDGTYDMWLYLTGFETSPPGPQTVVVNGGSGTKDITLNQFSGTLSGSIDLGGGADYENVSIELLSHGYSQYTPQATIDTEAGTYSFAKLGTSYYTLRAYYSTTGMAFERNMPIVNGRAGSLDIDLGGNTYSISGRVTSSARSPYTVSYMVNNSTPTTLYARDGSTVVVANRIVAQKLQRRDFGECYGTGCPVITYDPKTMFFGFYSSNGDYTISKLPAGSYLLSNNGEVNNDDSEVEIAQVSRVVHIVNAGLTNENFDLIDGYDVSGTIRVASGESETGRELRVILKNADDDPLAEEDVHLSGTSVAFRLERIPPGFYVIEVEDEQFPKKYADKTLGVEVVSADVSGVEISLLLAAKIQGKLRIKNTGVLLTKETYSQYLTSNFFVNAEANPWFEGGYHSSDWPLLNDDDYFVIRANPGNFDIIFRTQGDFGTQDAAQGKKSLAPLTIGGITVEAGETKDLGIIDLTEGGEIKGRVFLKNSNTADPADDDPMANIIVRARPCTGGESRWREELNGITDENGQFTLHGADTEGRRYYDVYVSPRPSPNDERFYGYQGQRYGEVVKYQFDTQSGNTLEFRLEPANGAIAGAVVTNPPGGTLELPWKDSEMTLGAALILNKRGNIPQDNPLGNIEDRTQPDGDFQIEGLAPGIYDMWVLVKGYSSGVQRNILVGNGVTTLEEPIEVLAGANLSGKLTKGDGSAPNESEIDVILAVRNGFEELIFGGFETDAAGTILSYTITGFQENKSYSILLFTQEGDCYSLASNVVVNSDTERDFVMEEKQPDIMTQAVKDDDGNVLIQFEFTRSLRNSQADADNNGIPDDNEILTLTSGGGSLGAVTISSDRKRATVTYDPAGETSFRLTVDATFVTVDPETGDHYAKSKTFTYYVGIRNQNSKRIANSNGGVVQLENDTSRFMSQAGTFGDTADETDDVIEVVFRASDPGTTPSSFPSPYRSRDMAVADKLGMKAYPDAMAAAINRAKIADVDPMSSFYEIFLPAGVRRSFPDGKEAQICVQYDEAEVTDVEATSLNIYYYNEETGEYLIENENKSVDTENDRICASISHASVFTLLASSASIITGGAYTGELTVMNFPNPFNLKSKSVTLQNPGTASQTQTVQGTMIKFSIPSGITGAVEIEIFNVAGEKVRTLRGDVTSGTGAHYYMEWDGTNERGEKVASGAYIARFTVGGENERFFKMAVLK